MASIVLQKGATYDVTEQTSQNLNQTDFNALLQSTGWIPVSYNTPAEFDNTDGTKSYVYVFRGTWNGQDGLTLDTPAILKITKVTPTSTWVLGGLAVALGGVLLLGKGKKKHRK